MKFVSTRGAAPAVGIDAALVAGLAPDGGLYVPESIPAIDLVTPRATLADTARAALAPWFAGSRIESQLADLCAAAFAFDAPLRPLAGQGDYLLELFHGPTAAFKDYAARFLAGALGALREPSSPHTTILVATSGDTGAAVAAAFHRQPGFSVVILYPEGRVSPRQAHGLACWGDNVRALRIDGSFDDCQRLAKTALSDASLRARITLGTANSISLGRLLPQVAYYAHAAAHHLAVHGRMLNVVIPTGNLGNACAALLARAMGAPLGDLHLACNANDTLSRFMGGAEYAPQPTRATLANAMDVGAPSNIERLRHWFDDDGALRAALQATSIDDATIRDTIAAAPVRHGIVPCPHTATALHVVEVRRVAGDTRDWAVVATAHPAKFDTIVEPLIGAPVAVPPALAASLSRAATSEPLPLDYDALHSRLLDHRG